MPLLLVFTRRSTSPARVSVSGEETEPLVLFGAAVSFSFDFSASAEALGDVFATVSSEVLLLMDILRGAVARERALFLSSDPSIRSRPLCGVSSRAGSSDFLLRVTILCAAGSATALDGRFRVSLRPSGGHGSPPHFCSAVVPSISPELT